jgi:DNA-binding transcriptional ArsR family regulator
VQARIIGVPIRLSSTLSYKLGMQPKDAIATLSALAHEGRLAAFRLLVQAGPEGIAHGEMARQLAVPPNTLSANLTILSNAGLIESRREGRAVVYMASYGQMTALLEFLIQDCCSGQNVVCAPLASVVFGSHCSTPGQA